MTHIPCCPRKLFGTTAEMSELQERFQRWADELVDLTARNELINFKVTKTSTILPEPKGLSKLLNGDTVATSFTSKRTINPI